VLQIPADYSFVKHWLWTVMCTHVHLMVCPGCVISIETEARHVDMEALLVSVQPCSLLQDCCDTAFAYTMNTQMFTKSSCQPHAVILIVNQRTTTFKPSTFKSHAQS
jgi:hypothetical protein